MAGICNLGMVDLQYVWNWSPTALGVGSAEWRDSTNGVVTDMGMCSSNCKVPSTSLQIPQ